MLHLVRRARKKKNQFILNSVSVSSSVAYSLRKLKNNYTGSAIKVRRSSDNAELDIGFANGELDTATLLTFADGGSAFVTTWYDQNGASINATQTTANLQPRIVNTGVVYTINGKPSINYHDNAGSTDMVLLTSTNAVHGHIAIVTQFGTGTETSTANPRLFHSGIDGWRVNNVGSVWTPANYFTATKNGSSPYTVDGTPALPMPLSVYTAYVSTRNDILRIGNFSGFPRNWNGGISEFISYPSTLSEANRKKIEQSAGKYYSITLA